MADLARIRADLAAFADHIGQALAAWQVPVLDKLFTAIVGARQMGKSRFLAVLALWLAIRKPEQEILLASSSEDGAKRLLAMALRFARKFPALAASTVDEQRSLVTFTNGSTIRAIATSEVSARGWTADAVLVDEAQLLSREFVDALVPTVTARDGRIVLAGTAGIAEGPFFDLTRQGEVGAAFVRSYRWVSTLAGGPHDAPWVRPSVIEAARETMSGQRFAAEYRAQFGSGADAVFPVPVLQAATADYRTTSLAEFEPSARISLGLDWGERADRTCAVGIARLPGQAVFGVAMVRRWPAGASIPGVIDEVSVSPAHYQAVWAERNGIGAACVQHLWPQLAARSRERGGGRRRNVVALTPEQILRDPPTAIERERRRAHGGGWTTEREAIFTTASMKASVFGAVRLMMEEGRLVLPACETELRSELLHLKSELTQSGVERISGLPHDDLAMSLLLAAGPIPDRSKGKDAWRCRIAELARRGVPEVTVPAAMERVATVSTGTGVEVSKTPAWQSILGSELTLPADLDLSKPEPRSVRDARASVAAALTKETR